MKRILILLILTVSPNFTALSQRISLDEFLAQENYYMLNKEFLRAERSLSDYERLLYRSFLLSVYNRPGESNNSIKTLLASFSGKLPDHTKAQLHKIQVTNYVRLFKYRDAWEHTNHLITNYSKEIDGNELIDQTNSNLIWRALKDVPMQNSKIHRGESIDMKKDKAGLWNLPVTLPGGDEDFLLDTGANFSVVCESIAKKNKWKIIEAGFEVGTATGEKVKANLALADSLAIGKSVFRNVIFLLVPDEKLTIKVNPMFSYMIMGIIGLPVIKEFGEIEIHNRGSLRIPSAISSKGYKNFAFSSFTPVLFAEVDGEMLAFRFDTGANSSGLSRNYLDKYRGNFAEARTITKTIGGAGGTRQIEAFELESLTLRIADELFTLRNVPVFKEFRSRGEKFTYGSLGQDVMKQSAYVVINFSEMYLEFKK